jgi:hypothetical protein
VYRNRQNRGFANIAEAQVQHDGGADDGRVARRPEIILKGYFSAESPPADSPPALNFDSPGQQKQREQSFHPRMHGHHVPLAGTVETPELFHHRITCRNLVVPGDDFV